MLVGAHLSHGFTGLLRRRAGDEGGDLTAPAIQVLVEYGFVFNDRLGGGLLDMTPEMVGSAVPPADHCLGRDAGHFLVNGSIA